MDYIAKAGGLTTEAQFPYQQMNNSVVESCSWDAKVNAPAVSIDGFIKLTSNSQPELLNAVANFGPIAISVDATNFRNYESGIFSGCDYA